jgi:hypothetical protein
MVRRPELTFFKPAFVAILVVAAVIAGCGSTASQSPETAASTSTTRGSSNDPCEPARVAHEVDGWDRAAREGQGTAIEVGDTTAVLDVMETAFPDSISVRFGEGRRFQPPDGTMLVAITYRLKNGGPGELKPSEDLNSRTLLQVSGELYPYAAKLPCSIPISASWALSKNGTNPAQRIEVGESTMTAVVFVVPKAKEGTEVTLAIPGQVGIELRSARS